MIRIFRWNAVAVLVTVFLISRAEAQTLPNEQVTLQGTGVSATYANGIASLSIAGSGPSTIGENSGSATLTYTFEIVGPSNTTVQVQFLADGTVYGNNDKTSATVSAALGSNSPQAACYLSQEGCPGIAGDTFAFNSFTGPFVYEVPSNTPLQITLTATWISGCCGDGTFGGGGAGGSVNARIAIDPKWIQKGFAIFYSAGANPTPVSLLATLQSEIHKVHPEGLEDRATDAQNHLQQSCVSLDRVIKEATANDDKKLSPEISSQIISSAKAVEALIGCN